MLRPSLFAAGLPCAIKCRSPSKSPEGNRLASSKTNKCSPHIVEFPKKSSLSSHKRKSTFYPTLQLRNMRLDVVIARKVNSTRQVVNENRVRSFRKHRISECSCNIILSNTSWPMKHHHERLVIFLIWVAPAISNRV